MDDECVEFDKSMKTNDGCQAARSSGVGAYLPRPLERCGREYLDVLDIPYGWSTQPLRRRRPTG
jgi:hypothetical protein